MILNRLLKISAGFLPYLAVFFASLFHPADPDLGWHLKYGEYFFSHGAILRDNTFSALMPNYHWNNSSWATDLLTYQAFNFFGFIGISILGALTIILTFFFIGKAAKLNLFEKSIIFPLILYFTNPVNSVSFRGQILSLMFMAIMFYILSIHKKDSKKILLLIPLFLLWSNFHGEFVLGIVLLLMWVGVYMIKEMFLNFGKNIKKLIVTEKLLLLASLGSVLSVVISPFGLGVYFESLGHLSNPLQKFVVEFLPIGELSTVWWHQILTGCIIFLGILLLGLGRKTLDKAPFYAPSIILFIMTFLIRRYAWPFYYSAIFLFQPAVNFLKPDNEKHTLYLTAFFVISFFSLSIALRYPFKDIRTYSWDVYCIKTVNCSPDSAKAVIDNKLNNDKLLTIYDYGGWLIWNYPNIKPTIDGRMHLWSENGFSAFGYYYPIEQNWKNIDGTPYNAVLTSHRKPIYQRLLELSMEGKWRLIYNDQNSAVFVRNKTLVNEGIVN